MNEVNLEIQVKVVCGEHCKEIKFWLVFFFFQGLN